ncbi:hypothetical protein BDP67DRAFT_570479 [Colletotrichum lupini]|nr:hypothetical protein BDP67DRAFT_570479 [Colletotrichum lupini]
MHNSGIGVPPSLFTATRLMGERLGLQSAAKSSSLASLLLAVDSARGRQSAIGSHKVTRRIITETSAGFSRLPDTWTWTGYLDGRTRRHVPRPFRSSLRSFSRLSPSQ